MRPRNAWLIASEPSKSGLTWAKRAKHQQEIAPRRAAACPDFYGALTLFA
jgi:hypothetical protein